MLTGKLFFALLSVSLVSASPLKTSQGEPASASSDVVSATSSGAQSDSVLASAVSAASSTAPSASGTRVGSIDDAALSALLDGNKEFKASSKLSIAQNLTKNGPEPPFMVFECADNRVTEGTIFHATLGTIFGQRNLGNLYSQTDPNANAALVYGVEELGVKHIIVMGHYGCPTVGAALMGNTTTAPKNKSRGEPTNSTHPGKEVETWIQPIREIYMSSNRSEIVALRNNKATFSTVPDASNAGFRALVEENVKASVSRIQKDSILAKAYQSKAGSSSAASSPSSTALSSSGHTGASSTVSPSGSRSSASSSGASSSVAKESSSGSASSKKAKGTPKPKVEARKEHSTSAKHKPSSSSSASGSSAPSSNPSESNTKGSSAASPSPTGTPLEIDVFVHGFVYDMDTGDVFNLGVTFGPPGKTLPKVPFSAVASATQAVQSAHSSSNTASAPAASGSAKSVGSTSASAS